MYFSSGTTWTQEILWQICNDGIIDTRPIAERYPFIDEKDQLNNFYQWSNPTEMQAALDSMPSPRLLKTHLPYGLAPKGKDEATKPRYIYVMRNPKDAAVSLYHHYRATKTFPYDKPWDHFFGLFMKNEGRKRFIITLNQQRHGQS